jgi:hypothetical protein
VTSPTTPRTIFKSVKTIPYYVKGLALGVPPYLVAIHMWTWVLTLPVFLSGRADFRPVYTAGYMVRTGHAQQLYDYDVQKQFQDKLISREELALPFLNPAYHAILFAPLSLLKYRTAYFAFLTVNLAALAICFAELRRWSNNLRAVYPWLPLSLFLGFLPIAATLIQGQSSILEMTLLLGAFVLLGKRRDFAAGILSALALFKLQITIPIALLFLIWRRWQYLFGFGICAVGLAALSVFLTGTAQTKLYLESLLSIAGPLSPASGFVQHPNLMPNIRGLVFGTCAAWLGRPWLQAIEISLTTAVLGWTAIQGFKMKNAANQFLMSIPCSVLVAHHTYIHDLSVLLIPTFLLLNQFLPCESEDNKNAHLICRGAALMFVAPVVESFCPNQFYAVSVPVLLLLVAVTAAASHKNTSGRAIDTDCEIVGAGEGPEPLTPLAHLTDGELL